MRRRARRLCLLSLALAALGCGDEAREPVDVPFWAQHLCENWVRPDGSCDLALLMADYEECFRVEGTPVTRRMLERGIRTRTAHRAGERKTNLCLEGRRWIMTEKGLERWRGPPKRGASTS
jgi:hypothetical protein